MIAYRNREQNVRVVRQFNDYSGRYVWYLEKKSVLFFGEIWQNAMPLFPVQTSDPIVLKGWIQHYKLEKA